MNTILVLPSNWWFGGTFTGSVQKGDVLRPHLHDLKWPAELRANPPRFRLLETPRHGRLCPCELLDPWPDAPKHWPERLPPGVSSNPGDPPHYAGD